MIGACVYIGQTLGSSIAGPVLDYFPTKWLLCGCMAINIASLCVFASTYHYGLVLTCRTCTGLFQILWPIYFPVWAETFGDNK